MTNQAATTAVILAAGKGTRMGSDKAKVLHELAGTPLVNHVQQTCREAGISQQVVVIGHQREAVAEVVAGPDVECAIQDQQLGTGHAVMVTEAAVKHGLTIVLCGDAPLVPASLLQQLIAEHSNQHHAATVVAARLADPTGYGRIITDETGGFACIVEQKDGTPEQLAVDLVNSGIMAFNTDLLFPTLKELRPENAQGEYYLTDVPKMLLEAGHKVGVAITDDPAAVFGINTPEHLAEAEKLFAQRS